LATESFQGDSEANCFQGDSAQLGAGKQFWKLTPQFPLPTALSLHNRLLNYLQNKLKNFRTSTQLRRHWLFVTQSKQCVVTVAYLSRPYTINSKLQSFPSKGTATQLVQKFSTIL
jgi:hypothetical protein